MTLCCAPDDTRPDPSPRDPLADVLDLLRVRGAVMAHLHAFAPWGLRLQNAPGAIFHAVMEGECWLRMPDEPPRLLKTGDVMLLPTGAAHILASDPAGPTRSWTRVSKTRERNAAGEITLGSGGRAAHLICAAYDYDRDVAHPLLSVLPTTLVLGAPDLTPGNAVHATLSLLRQELMRRSAGSATVIDRLIDVLFVHVIRAWLSASQERETSWLIALRDPIIARALTALHTAPAQPWTAERLAREVSLSRATLMRRFTALVGEPPLAYLTRWRMDLAAQLLRETGDAVSVIAHRVGYSSEFSFSRAFARVRGRPPGRYRAESQAVARARDA